MTLHEAKIQAIDKALLKNKGNRLHAAKELGISIRGIRYWLKREKGLKRWRIKTKKPWWQ